MASRIGPPTPLPPTPSPPPDTAGGRIIVTALDAEDDQHWLDFDEVVAELRITSRAEAERFWLHEWTQVHP